MKLFDREEFKKYIKDNYTIIAYNDSVYYNKDISEFCSHCERDVFLRIKSHAYIDRYSDNFPDFSISHVQCPNCYKESFFQTIAFKEKSNTNSDFVFNFYKLLELPFQDNNFEIKDIPEEHSLLKKTIIEAKFNLDNSQYMSSAMMYRRGLQILAKQVLGAKGKTLFNQLNWLKDNQNILNIELSELFHDNSNLIREVGNQSAHPEEDEELHEFTKEDAFALHDLFLILVNEIFVLPEKLNAMKNELKNRRKLN
ncbi:DUF4145 domain-containing protein [Empedobacter brevis]|uniref:DUF4145 domain-containing protein n=1 Tax=Empedobacter brevis TaxID=247 RepID=UPI00289E8448|nr:DUF4145 domain-containing protein [Empedobacter brevis]